MRIGELLESLDGPVALREARDQLARLEGAEVGPVRYLNTVAQARALRAPWMPVWFVPLGNVSPDRVFGLDLRPELLAAGRLSVAEVFGPGDLLGTADGLDTHLRWHLARAERRERMDNPAFQRSPELVAAHQAAWRAFARDLFSSDALDGVDDVLTWLWDQGDRAPYTASLLSGSDHKANLSRLQASELANPGCMVLGLVGAGPASALRDLEEAARQLGFAARSMRYTVHNFRIDAAHGSAAGLAKHFPAHIPTDALARFLCADAAALRARLTGDVAPDEAARLVTDLGYEDDTMALAAPLLRPRYAAAGWTVAAALCDVWGSGV